MSLIQSGFIYWFFVVLLMIGMYGAVGKDNLVKKLIGLSIFQTAIILFYVSIGVKEESGIPILGHGQYHEIVEEGKPSGEVITKDAFANPLPHVLMLTAIVVGVSTLGLALAISQRIHSSFGTLEEDEILDQLRPGGHD